MPYSLQQLSDLEDIKVLKHRYFRAIDTADEAILRNPKTGLLEGANDRRRPSGLAAGY